LQRGQPCFSISCCHLGPNIFFRISGSLTPMVRPPTCDGSLQKRLHVNLEPSHEYCKPALHAATYRRPSRELTSLLHLRHLSHRSENLLEVAGRAYTPSFRTSQ